MHLLSKSAVVFWVSPSTVHTQSGVTLFHELLVSVFEQTLFDHLTARVLPVSTVAPTDLTVLFDQEIEEIKRLLKPGTRQRTNHIRLNMRPAQSLSGF
jgi:hypothetical protein